MHHEDLRRGGGDTTPRPATQIAHLEDALWRALGRSGRFMTRALRGTGVEAVTPAGDRAAAPGDRPVVLTGRPGELVLWLFGRRDAAAVELTGDPEAIEAAPERRPRDLTTAGRSQPCGCCGPPWGGYCWP
ncbi:MAG: hypothetical protein R2699_03105 [Acidimicrobiales bacterium]